MTRHYVVERNEYGLYTVERRGHGGTQTVCSTENQAEAANVCTALNLQESLAQETLLHKAGCNCTTCDESLWRES